MPSTMQVQAIATERNSFAEMLIDYVLKLLSDRLYAHGYIHEKSVPERQKPFIRNDCNDVFDHYLKLHFTKILDMQERTFEIWAQTTCYKGNETGKPESNKTYEIRETLVEALTLRKWLINENTNFRTIHFTLGPSNYTYGWFKIVKKNAFDLSLYPDYAINRNLFDDLAEVGTDVVFQFNFYEKLDSIMEEPNNPLCCFISQTIDSLITYFRNGFQPSEMADKQAHLLNNIQNASLNLFNFYIESSKGTGMDIKGSSIRMLDGEETSDHILSKTLSRLIKTNPFIPVALEALSNWEEWSENVFYRSTQETNLACYVHDLWSDNSANRYGIRRLLMRIYATSSINYIQDLAIVGVDEHNLYNGDHTQEQISQIVEYLCNKYRDNGINSVTALLNKLKSNQARNIINESLKFERINGTSLKPSFFYLEEYISSRYKLTSFEEANLAPPVAYYAKFSEGLNVKPYDNLKVVQDKYSHKNIAIIKGKFFRKQEFQRRVKEESYVGITAQYDLVGNSFTEKYPNMPFIMFIDMAKSYSPPEFALRRLINYGWCPFFQLDKLMNFLDNVNERIE